MSKLFSLSLVVGSMLLSVEGLALANGSDHRDDRRDDHHGAAPEPLTVIGLALGAGAIGTARWLSRRKSP